MAEKDKTEKQTEKPEGAAENAPKRSKKPIFLGGGVVGLVAAAYIVSMVALPGEKTIPPFAGPFITELTPGDVQVNLKGNNGQRYLVMRLQAKYMSYDEDYVKTRTADPVYQAEMVNLLIGLGRQKTMDDVEDDVGEEAFFAQVREAAEPLIFPVHVGNAASFLDPHEASGIAPGRSIEKSTMRGGFKAHTIKIDGPKGEISLDEGPVGRIDSSDDDFMLETENGLTIYVDLTGLRSDFVGAVNVGTFGRTTTILTTKFLFQ